MAIQQSNDGGLRELALFAGAGGGILGGKLLGWRTGCAVERDAYAAQVLAQRQNDGCLPAFPIWSDVETFDGRPWKGLVDVVSGGFPCQDISAAGTGAGIAGARSGLWFHMARIIREVEPDSVLVENSPMLTSRGLGTVLGDLASLGFDAEWGVISAADTGAPHLRERIWIVANARGRRFVQPKGWEVEQPRRAEAVGPGPDQAMANPDGKSWHEGRQGDSTERQGGRDLDRGGIGEALADTACQRFGEAWRSESWCRPPGCGGTVQPEWPPEPGLGRVAHGVADRVDRLRAIGNGQVPRVAATAWRLLA
jgi:DNA (cytosine-5)-methyltransferase 1